MHFKGCFRKFNLSKESFDRMTDILGIRNINYFFNANIDNRTYTNALENLLRKLNNETEMEKRRFVFGIRDFVCLY